ncbi:MAG: hypothetical protein JO322_12580 [Candidatus Eremiobacteraeota bacterium]|nr:hypothetical protein [Candidatus Eremiobacteraeota bacterium]
MASPYRYTVRTIHGAAKLESELDDLSSEGWEPISFQHDAAGNFEIILRQDHNERPNGTVREREPAASGSESARYTVRSIRAPKFESELTGLSGEGWEALSFQHESAGTYEVVLRREPNSAGRKATSYRYALRSIHGAVKLESQLAELSADGWEPVRLVRDAAGTYEAILRQKTIST